MYVHNQRYRSGSVLSAPLILGVAALFVVAVLLLLVKSTLSHPTVYGTNNFEPIELPTEDVELKWPNYGQAAIGAKGFGVLEEVNTEKPQPTASVAKVMTALAVLDKYPIHEDGEGQTIKITPQDAELFGEYWAKNGTSVNVPAGSEISQYQALQYVLVPSANNIADNLATWAFGSMENYTEYANELAKEIGMTNTTISDASGFSPETVSTASDLVKLGEAAMNNPIIADIVGQWQVSLPDGSKANNSNLFLDFENNGVNGIKTGDTDEAGGVYLFSADYEVDGETVTIIGAVMGAKSLFKAEQDGMKLLASSLKGFEKTIIAQQGQVVGNFDLPWQGSVDAALSEDIEFIRWLGRDVSAEVEMNELSDKLDEGSTVGNINILLGSETKSFPISVSSDTTSPSIGWRITHPRLIN